MSRKTWFTGSKGCSTSSVRRNFVDRREKALKNALMVRGLSAILLLALLATSAEAAKRRKKRAPKKPKVQTEEAAVQKEPKETAESEKAEAAAETTEAAAPVADTQEPKSEAVSGSASGEMDAYRAIQARPESTVQDLADLMLMYRSEYAKYPTPEKRLERARELKLIRKQKGEDLLERGTLAYALMKKYAPESGILFMLTGWERYALRDVQEAGIMPNKSTVGQHLSGDQLLAIMTDAEEYVTKRSEWQKEEKQK